MNLKPHQYWAINVTLFFHVILFWFLFFVEMRKSAERLEYELELAPEPNKESELEEKIKIEERADAELKEMMTSEASKRLVRGEQTHEEVTTEVLQEEFAELKKEQLKVSKEEKPQLTFEKTQDTIERKTEQKEERQTIFYVGKSRVEYFLAERYRVKLPIPVYQCEGGGTVEVAIAVNRKGVVVGAEVVKHRSRSASDCMHAAALHAALASVFSERPEAPVSQQGRIVYKFAPQ
ncbi:hypothetical protein C7377_0409 [Balneicella halophila]|uniref:TonB family protein n=1 Tax=Balneicella halophila TaxID=1537566 RepID=A0A7L4UQS9_BALHA|nr:hypothetical protein [Balneicella halophila]PVX52110.1 hypothetical protein C7377_0409 [Balneicella halophila]